ncbi:ATP-binding cassette domain-containing protein [Amphibacillus jilinensis]|uniref:ATP-binding cassette domain-containing protein n=1 Tax=Amphibacillus jilinensis TaxID=1216008 RepID=UPI00030A1D2E|nr:ABC transporter ATP-binding protein [Amphibacillus jilinensis]
MLAINDLNYSYDKKNKVLDTISFQLDKGEFLTIAGPNGSGKTTLIKLITDLLKIQEGQIMVDGVPHHLPLVKKTVVYLSSEDYLPEFLTGFEYIKMLCNMYEVILNQEAMTRLANYYSLDTKLDKLIEEYSHGMKKKIQLLSAFLIDAPLLIIDETLNGIDVEAKEATKLLLNRYQHKGGATIFCTHDLELVEEIGERVILIHKGRVAVDSAVSKIVKGNGSLINVFKKLINYEDMKNEITEYF